MSNRPNRRKRKKNNRKKALRQEQRGLERRDRKLSIEQQLDSVVDRRARLHGQKMADSCADFCRTIGNPSSGELGTVVLDAGHLGNVTEMGIAHFRLSWAITTAPVTAGGYAAQIVAAPANSMHYDRTVILWNTTSTQATAKFPTGGATALPTFQTAAWTTSPYIASSIAPGDVQYTPVCAQLTVHPTSQVLQRQGSWVIGNSPDTSADDASDRTWAELASYKYARIVDGKQSWASTWVPSGLTDHEHLVSASLQVPDDMNMWAMWVGDSAASWVATLDVFYYDWGRIIQGSDRIMRVPNLWACVRDAYSDPRTQPVVDSEDSVDRAKQRAGSTFLQVAGAALRRIATVGFKEATGLVL
jgi:hypothetical protein